MSLSYPDNPTASPQIILRAAALSPELPLGSLLTEHDLHELSEKHQVSFGNSSNAIYTPFVTLWAFLSQFLSSAKQCASAVTRVGALRIAFGLPDCSKATGSFCIARGKLPVPFLRDLACRLGDRLEEHAAKAWRWKGRTCYLVDGTTLSAPDTPENQKVYPQSKSQKPGLGFPLIRVVLMLGLATAGLVGAAMAPWSGKRTGETSLFRSLLERLRRHALLLLDAGFCSFWTALLQWQRGIDVVMRLKEAKMSKASEGKKLGAGDYLVVWSRPEECPEWMDKETYRSLPKTLTLREIHISVRKRGFRTEKVILITTLLDSEVYSAEEIGELYRQRWHVELDIRNIKTQLGMDILLGKTPEMVERELWGHLLVYNLVRRLQAQAALKKGCLPRQLSFAAARRQLAENWMLLSTADEEKHVKLVEACVRGAATTKVGNRPDRYEPRRVKRRRKDAKLLTKPRAEAREDVAAGKETRETKRRRGAAAKGKAKTPAPQD
jgi:hypothetical protein